MSDATLHVFTMPIGIELTSIVMDENEVVEFVGSLPIDQASQQRIIRIGCLPMMSRGNKTSQFFEKYGVTTDYLAAIVRGTAAKLGEAFLGGFQTALKKAVDAREAQSRSQYN